MTSPIARLNDFGQSPWYDNLTRAVARGGLRDLVAEHGIRGVTSNPTIFEKAMGSGTDYDDQLRELVGGGRASKPPTGRSSSRTSPMRPTSCGRTTTPGAGPTGSFPSRSTPTWPTTRPERSRRRRICSGGSAVRT